MANVQVQKRPQESKPIWSFLEDVQSEIEDLRERAYQMFKSRGGEHGSPLEDWLKAEREVFALPPSELCEQDDALTLEAETPGMKPKDIEVTVSPSELIVRAKAETKEKRTEGKMHVQERSTKRLFRHYDLPTEIDPKKVKATMTDGLLTVTMPKAVKRQVPVEPGVEKAEPKRAKAAAA